MHRSVHLSAVVTCLCWIAAFLLGSVPFGHLLQRSSLRRDLRRLEGRRGDRGGWEPVDLRLLLTGGVPDPTTALPSVGELVGSVLDTAKVVALATGALVLVRMASPGFHRGDLPPASDLGFLADEVLTFWQSAALWAGLAATVGHLYPVWLGFKGQGQGQAPVLALTILIAPSGFVVAVAVFLLTLAVRRDQGWAVAASLTAFVGWMWASWLWELPHWWGLLPGAELAIWAAVMAGVVAGRATPRRHPPA